MEAVAVLASLCKICGSMSLNCDEHDVMAYEREQNPIHVQ